MTYILAAAMLSSLPYDQAYAKAIKAGSPLVVGVGCAAPHGYPDDKDNAWLVSHVRELKGYKAPCLVVAVPDRDANGPFMRHVKTLPPSATAEDIRAVLPKANQNPVRKWNPYQQRTSSVSFRGGSC